MQVISRVQFMTLDLFLLTAPPQVGPGTGPPVFGVARTVGTDSSLDFWFTCSPALVTAEVMESADEVGEHIRNTLVWNGGSSFASNTRVCV